MEKVQDAVLSKTHKHLPKTVNDQSTIFSAKVSTKTKTNLVQPKVKANEQTRKLIYTHRHRHRLTDTQEGGRERERERLEG